MQDRGDKIVTLAREILRADAVPVATKNAHVTLSFRTLCLVTVLAALGGSGATALVADMRRPLDQYEKTELDALVFYAARQKGIDESILRHEVLEKLKLASFGAMTERDFIQARAYLQSRAN